MLLAFTMSKKWIILICKHTFYYFLGNKKYPGIYILSLSYKCSSEIENHAIPMFCLKVRPELASPKELTDQWQLQLQLLPKKWQELKKSLMRCKKYLEVTQQVLTVGPAHNWNVLRGGLKGRVNVQIWSWSCISPVGHRQGAGEWCSEGGREDTPVCNSP